MPEKNDVSQVLPVSTTQPITPISTPSNKATKFLIFIVALDFLLAGLFAFGSLRASRLLADLSFEYPVFLQYWPTIYLLVSGLIFGWLLLTGKGSTGNPSMARILWMLAIKALIFITLFIIYGTLSDPWVMLPFIYSWFPFLPKPNFGF